MATTQDNISLVNQEDLDNLKKLDDYLADVNSSALELVKSASSLNSEFKKSGQTYKELNSLISQYSDLEANAVKVQQEQNKSLTDINNLKQKVIKRETEMQKVISESNSAIEENISLQNISRKAYENATKSINEQQTNLVLLQKELSNVQTNLKNLEKEYKQRLITDEQYAQRRAKLLSQENDQKNVIKQLSNEIKLNNQIINTSIGSYNNLSAQYSLLKNRINDLSDSETYNGNTKQQLERQAKSLYEEMNRLQKATGRNQLQVGNYDLASKDLVKTLTAINPAFGKAAAGANTLNAALLRLVVNPVGAVIAGIAATLALVVAVYGRSFIEIKKNEQAYNDLKVAMTPITILGDQIRTIFAGIGDAFVSATTAISGFITRGLDAIGITNNLSEAVNKYSSIQENNLEITKRQRDLNLEVATTEREIAQLRSNIADQESFSNEERLKFSNQIIAKENELLQKEKDLAQARLDNIRSTIEARGLEGQTEWIEKENQAAIEVERIENRRLAQLRANTRERQTIIRQITTDADNASKIQTKAINDEIKAQAELNKLRGQISSNTYKEILSDETNSYQDRITAANEYYNILSSSIIASRDEQLKSTELTASQRLLIEEKANYEIVRLNNERSKNIVKIENDQVKQQQAVYDRQSAERTQSIITAQIQEEAQLAALYSKGQISKREYEIRKTEIQIKYGKERFNSELQHFDDLAQLYTTNSREYENLQRKRAEISARFEKQISDNEITEIEKRKRRIEQFYQQLSSSLQQLASQLNTTIFTFASNRITEETNLLNKQAEEIAAIYERRTNEIQYQEERGLISAEQASYYRQQIAEQEQLENKRIDQEKKRLQLEQAKLDKKQAKFDIAINTAVAIIAAYKLGPILGSILAGVVAGVGAAQLAAVNAQPLPQYKDGTDNHPGGLAIVGDGGKSEMMITPSGNIFKTPGKPMIIDMPKGTQVLPDYNKAISSMPLDGIYNDNIIVINENKKQLHLLDKSLELSRELSYISKETLGQMKATNNLLRYTALNNKINRLLKH